MKAVYEWVAEQSDEHGDIQDVIHADTLAEVLPLRSPTWQIALLRMSYTEAAGEQNRYYAYLGQDGALPEVMESCDGAQDGPAVPQRFHDEAARVAG